MRVQLLISFASTDPCKRLRNNITHYCMSPCSIIFSVRCSNMLMHNGDTFISSFCNVFIVLFVYHLFT